MAMYLGGQAVKILAPSINLFDKSLIELGDTDFVNCSEYELSADRNTIIARGNSDSTVGEFNYNTGWVRCGAAQAEFFGKGIQLKKDDIITVSADFTLIEQGDKDAVVRCYVYSASAVYLYDWSNKRISKTPQRITWEFTVTGDAQTFYTMFLINSNKVKIENISVNKVKDNWRIRSGVNMGRNPKNLIPFPYANDSLTTNGITWTVNDDGTVTANGTATATIGFALSIKSDFIKPNTQYIFSAVPKGSNSNSATFNFYAYVQANKNGEWYREYGDFGDGTVFTAESDCDLSIHLWIRAGTTANNVTFKPMLNEGTKALPYYYYD